MMFIMFMLHSGVRRYASSLEKKASYDDYHLGDGDDEEEEGDDN